MSFSSSLPSFPAPSGACGVLGLLQSGTAFASSATGLASQLQNQITGMVATFDSLPSILTGVDQSIIANFQAQLTGVLAGAISSLEAHIASQIAGLVTNLGMAVSHLAAQAGLSGTGGGCSFPSNAGNTSTDPCASIESLFGSIIGAANPLLDGISAQLNNLTGLINGLSNAANIVVGDVLNTINEAIGTMMGIANQITVMIAAEVAQLSAMLNELLNFAQISSLFGLLNNPCAKNVLSAVSTPAMASSLGI